MERICESSSSRTQLSEGRTLEGNYKQTLGAGKCVGHSQDSMQKSLESSPELHKGMMMNKFGHISE